MIYGELIHLNDYIRAERSHRSKAAQIKREETDRVAYEAMASKAKPIPLRHYPVSLEISWFSKDARVDIDNVSFAKKFILDGLVECGVLAGDDRKHVAGFSETFLIDRENPRIEVVIHKLSPPGEN